MVLSKTFYQPFGQGQPLESLIASQLTSMLVKLVICSAVTSPPKRSRDGKDRRMAAVLTIRAAKQTSVISKQ